MPSPLRVKNSKIFAKFYDPQGTLVGQIIKVFINVSSEKNYSPNGILFGHVSSKIMPSPLRVKISKIFAKF